MNSNESSKVIFVAMAFAALAVFPFFSGNFGIDLVSKIMVYAIFALSLELLVGTTGLVSLGHAAFFGLGAYTLVLASPDAGGSMAWLAPLSVSS